MLLTLYYLLVNVAVPQMGAYTQALFEPIMLIVISLAGYDFWRCRNEDF